MLAFVAVHWITWYKNISSVCKATKQVELYCTDNRQMDMVYAGASVKLMRWQSKKQKELDAIPMNSTLNQLVGGS